MVRSLHLYSKHSRFFFGRIFAPSSFHALGRTVWIESTNTKNTVTVLFAVHQFFIWLGFKCC